MGVRVFITVNSGNQKIENAQQTILQVLKTRNIDHETVDIAAPGMQDMRKFMREKGKKRDGQRNALPPQIFNGEEFRGDFEDFDIANEDDILEEFLGIPRKNPKAEPVKTGAVAPEVGRLKPGKLDIKQIEKNKAKKDTNDDNMSSSQEDQECEAGAENESNWSESVNDTDSGFKDDTETESIDNRSDEEGEDSDNAWKNEDSNKNRSKNCDDPSKKKAGVDEAEDKDKEDNNLGLNVDEGFDLLNGDEDSSDYDSSSDEDNVVEFMPDGEVIRKKSRGFKQLNNCKRFWKASLMLDKV